MQTPLCSFALTTTVNPFPVINTSLNKSPESNKTTPTLPSDLFLEECLRLGIIDSQGNIQTHNLPDLPLPSQKAINAINAWLDRKIHFKTGNTHMNCSVRSFLNCLDLSKGRLYLVGGALKKFLGASWFQAAAETLLGLENYEKTKVNGGLVFNFKSGEVDLRFVAYDQKQDPRSLAENFLKNIVECHAPSNVDTTGYCNELRNATGPFEVFDSHITIENGIKVSDTFLITTKAEIGEEIDLLLASKMKEQNVLSMEDLFLDITDFLKNSKAPLQLTGTTCFGWQSVIAYIGKIIQVQHVNKKVWTRVMIKFTERYRCLIPLPEAMYEGLNLVKLTTQLQRAARIHLQNNPIAQTILLINGMADLLHRQFHEADVDQLCKLFPVEADLPQTLKIMRHYAEKLPMTIVLSCLRMAVHLYPNNTPLKYGPWEIHLPQNLQHALEKLIAFEKQIAQYRGAFKNLLHDLGIIQIDPKTQDRWIIAIIKKLLPDFLEFGCFLYFKNQEENTGLTTELVSLLPPLRAVQMLTIHLNHVKTVSKEHLTLGKSVIVSLLSHFKNIHPVEAVNHVIALLKTLSTFSKSDIITLLKALENIVEQLINKQSCKIACLILKSTAEAGFVIENYSLWLVCFKYLFQEENDWNKLLKFWNLVERVRGSQNLIQEPQDLDFFVPFITALSHQDNCTYVELANELLDKINLQASGNRAKIPNPLRMGEEITCASGLCQSPDAQVISSSILNIQIQKKMAEITAAKKTENYGLFKSKITQPVFTSLEEWKKNTTSPMDKKTQQEFIQWLDHFHARASVLSWLSQTPVHFIAEVISSTEYSQANQNEVLTSIRNIVTLYMDRGDFSEPIINLLAFLLSRLPQNQDILKLLMRLVSDESRPTVVTEKLRETLTTCQTDIIEKLHSSSSSHEICRFLNYFETHNIQWTMNDELLYLVYLPAIRTTLQKQTCRGYIPRYLEAVLYSFKEAVPQITSLNHPLNPSQLHEMESFIEELTGLYKNYGQEEWIHLYLHVSSQTIPPPSSIDILVLDWTKKLIQQNICQSVPPLLGLLHDRFPQLKKQIFYLIMTLPNTILFNHLSVCCKILLSCSQAGFLKKNSFHVNSKILDFIKEILQSPSSFEFQKTALDIIENGIKDVSQQEYLVKKNLPFITDPSLKVRIWSLFRIRFHEYLLQLKPPYEAVSSWVKTWRISHTLLQSLAEKQDKKLLIPLEKNSLDFYLDNNIPLIKWLEKKKLAHLIMEDIESIFSALHQFSAENISLQHLKKIRKILKRLMEIGFFYTSYKDYLSKIVQIHSEIAVQSFDFSQFYKGLEALNGLIKESIIRGKIDMIKSNLFCQYIAESKKFPDPQEENEIFNAIGDVIKLHSSLEFKYNDGIFSQQQIEQIAKALVSHPRNQAQTFDTTENKDIYVNLRALAKIPLSNREQRHYNKLHPKPYQYQLPHGILELNKEFATQIYLFLLAGFFLYCFWMIGRDVTSDEKI